MNNQKAMLLSAAILAAAIIIGPILLEQFKFSQCMKAVHLDDACIRYIN